MMKNNIAVYCKTEQEAKNVLTYWHMKGAKWISGLSLLESSRYGLCESNVAYFLENGRFVTRDTDEESYDEAISYREYFLKIGNPDASIPKPIASNKETQSESKPTEKSPLLEAAKCTFELFVAYKQAGFTSSEAMILICKTLEVGAKQGRVK